MTDMTQPRATALSTKLLSGAAIALLIRLISAGLSFVSMIMVSRWIGPHAYGEFAVMLTLGSFLGLAATAGLPTLALRAIQQIAAAQGRQADAAIRAFVRTTCGVILGIGLVISGVMIVASGLLQSPTMLYAACLVVPFAFAEHLAHLLRGLGRITSALLPRDVLWYGLISALGAVAVLWWPGWSAGATGALVCVAAILTMLITGQGAFIWVALKDPQAMMKPPARSAESAPEKYKFGWRSEVPLLWLSTMSNAVQRHLGIVVTAPFLTAIETGAFFAAHRTALMLSLPLIAANLVAAPLIARAWAEGDKRRIQHLCSLIAIGASLPAFLGLGVIALGGEWLLGLFDPAFAVALTVLYIFGAGSLINAFCGPTGYVMLMTGNERPFVLIQIASQAIGLLFMAAGAAYFGLIGAAVGAIFGTIGWNLGVWYWCQTRLGINPTITAWLSRKPTLSSD